MVGWPCAGVHRCPARCPACPVGTESQAEYLDLELHGTPAAYEVARAWGFRPSTLLTWCKAPMGSGLGLPMALATVQAHGGKITAGRSEDGGALFEVTVPREPTDPHVTSG